MLKTWETVKLVCCQKSSCSLTKGGATKTFLHPHYLWRSKEGSLLHFEMTIKIPDPGDITWAVCNFYEDSSTMRIMQSTLLLPQNLKQISKPNLMMTEMIIFFSFFTSKILCLSLNYTLTWQQDSYLEKYIFSIGCF